jgi:hypothetical protein
MSISAGSEKQNLIKQIEVGWLRQSRRAVLLPALTYATLNRSFSLTTLHVYVWDAMI